MCGDRVLGVHLGTSPDGIMNDGVYLQHLFKGVESYFPTDLDREIRTDLFEEMVEGEIEEYVLRNRAERKKYKAKRKALHYTVLDDLTDDMGTSSVGNWADYMEELETRSDRESKPPLKFDKSKPKRQKLLDKLLCKEGNFTSEDSKSSMSIEDCMEDFPPAVASAVRKWPERLVTGNSGSGEREGNGRSVLIHTDAPSTLKPPLQNFVGMLGSQITKLRMEQKVSEKILLEKSCHELELALQSKDLQGTARKKVRRRLNKLRRRNITNGRLGEDVLRQLVSAFTLSELEVIQRETARRITELRKR
jgi:signal recognition particle GTPase